MTDFNKTFTENYATGDDNKSLMSVDLENAGQGHIS